MIGCLLGVYISLGTICILFFFFQCYGNIIIDETYVNTIQPKNVEIIDEKYEIEEEIKVEENAVEENIENNSASENKENVVEESSIDETIIEDNKEEI